MDAIDVGLEDGIHDTLADGIADAFDVVFDDGFADVVVMGIDGDIGDGVGGEHVKYVALFAV